MTKKSDLKKCELCNCKAGESDYRYFDFCFECISREGQCKKCKTKPDLDDLTKLRLETEAVIMCADWAAERSNKLRKILKELVDNAEEEQSD